MPLCGMSGMRDIFIIGGGINGCGIARDAAGRGLSVTLAEQYDLASGTSSSSTKLIHGGLRYLEYYEFRLVREALQERERLLTLAPHIVWPLRFILPHNRHQRPQWMIWLGLKLYDRLGGKSRLAKSRKVDLAGTALGAPLNDGFSAGFSYPDCWVDDARLVVLNAQDARDHGAEILPRSRAVKAVRGDGHWAITLENTKTGERTERQAKILVNAGGPWVRLIKDNVLDLNDPKRIRLVKGSHIVVERIFDGDHAYILQNHDGRVIFAIPYEEKFTLIGTTEVEFRGDPKEAAIEPTEIAYLLESINHHFKITVRRQDIVWTYAGVRPLYDDQAETAAAVTRDYVLQLDSEQAPMLTVYGGKITTFRRLSEHCLEKLAPFLPKTAPWTGHKPLSGGDMSGADFTAFLTKTAEHYPWLPDQLRLRLARQYGTCINKLLENAASLSDLGQHFGAGLYAREVDYLKKQEWALEAADILWRRTKRGLHMSEAERQAFDEAFAHGMTS